ncbi:hypothetical protein E3P96_01803 [Wallemia ichthyophaga]|nr:hypothetical protein E3P96_01803 [Wallemia ichthyophaga]
MSDIQKYVESVLIENGLGDEDLNLISEYIVVMITNQKSQNQVTSEMCDLIGDRYTAKITHQIFDHFGGAQGVEEGADTGDAQQQQQQQDYQQLQQSQPQEQIQLQPQQPQQSPQHPQHPPQPTSSKRSAADASLDDIIFGNKQQSNYRDNQRDNQRDNKRRNQNHRHPRLDPETYKLSKDLTTNFLESNPQLKKQYESYNFTDRTNFERQLLQQHFMTMQTAKVMQQQFEKMQQDAEEKAAQRMTGTPTRGGMRGRGGSRGASRGGARGGFANKSATFSNQNKASLDKPLTDDAPKHQVWVRGVTDQQQPDEQATELPKSKKFSSDGSEKVKQESNT